MGDELHANAASVRDMASKIRMLKDRLRDLSYGLQPLVNEAANEGYTLSSELVMVNMLQDLNIAIGEIQTFASQSSSFHDEMWRVAAQLDHIADQVEQLVHQMSSQVALVLSTVPTVLLDFKGSAGLGSVIGGDVKDLGEAALGFAKSGVLKSVARILTFFDQASYEWKNYPIHSVHDVVVGVISVGAAVGLGLVEGIVGIGIGVGMAVVANTKFESDMLGAKATALSNATTPTGRLMRQSAANYALISQNAGSISQVFHDVGTFVADSMDLQASSQLPNLLFNPSQTAIAFGHVVNDGGRLLGDDGGRLLGDVGRVIVSPIQLDINTYVAKLNVSFGNVPQASGMLNWANGAADWICGNKIHY